MEDVNLTFTLTHQECLMVVSGVGVILDLFQGSPEWARDIMVEMTRFVGDNPGDRSLFDRPISIKETNEVWDGAMTALALLRAMMAQGDVDLRDAWFTADQVDALGQRLSDALVPYLNARKAEAE